MGGRRPNLRAERALEEATHRVGPFEVALRLWERVLSPADRARLGGDPGAAWRARGTAGLWAELRGVSRARAAVEVARRTDLMTAGDEAWLLEELGEAGEESVEEAVAGGGLVLTERPRAAYWDGEEIGADWDRRAALWDYLQVLCRDAKAGRPTDGWSFGGSKRVDVTDRKSKLKALKGFPAGLAARIVTAGRGTQRLDLPPDRIRLFDVGESGAVREWLP